MATVTGTLTDFGLQALTPYAPTLVLIPAKPAVSADGGVLATRPLRVTPAADGSFTFNPVVASVDTSPETMYALRIEWLDSASNYTGMDLLSGLVVPLGLSQINDLSGIPVSRWWVGPEPPDDPEAHTWWLDTTNGDLKEWV